jgi:hypothetical protein
LSKSASGKSGDTAGQGRIVCGDLDSGTMFRRVDLSSSIFSGEGVKNYIAADKRR